jgi:hypothetical protein
MPRGTLAICVSRPPTFTHPIPKGGGGSAATLGGGARQRWQAAQDSNGRRRRVGCRHGGRWTRTSRRHGWLGRPSRRRDAQLVSPQTTVYSASSLCSATPAASWGAIYFLAFFSLFFPASPSYLLPVPSLQPQLVHAAVVTTTRAAAVHYGPGGGRQREETLWGGEAD